MTHNDFTYKELFRESYELTKKHFPFLVGLLAIDILIGWILSPIPLVGQLVSMALAIATVYITLSLVKGGSPSYKDMLAPFKNYLTAWHYFLATLLMFLLVALVAVVSMLTGLMAGILIAGIVGLSALNTIGIAVVPAGIIATISVAGTVFVILVSYYGIRLGFYKFFIIDNEKTGPFESLKKSLHVTAGRFWKITGFFILLALLNLCGVVAFVIGLIFTLPMTLLAGTLLYKKLSRLAPEHEHNGGHHIATQ